MQSTQITVAGPGNVSAAEIAQFDGMAAQWWDPRGPMRPLHRMNPARIAWIAARMTRVFGDAKLRVLDVGCGGGLAAEALAVRGHDVLGIDAAGAAIDAARSHAAGRGLTLAYRTATAEDLAAEGLRFQVVTALEVIEHVPDPSRFVADLGRLVEPGGMVFLSTLNRSRRAYAVAKLGAEYLLRWLPVGTHDWRKFVTPAELGAHIRAAGLRLDAISGLTVDLAGQWHPTRSTAVNYIAAAIKDKVGG